MTPFRVGVLYKFGSQCGEAVLRDGGGAAQLCRPSGTELSGAKALVFLSCYARLKPCSFSVTRLPGRQDDLHPETWTVTAEAKAGSDIVLENSRPEGLLLP